MSETEESLDIFASIGAIYLLSKEELIARMTRTGLSTEGTLATLRARLSAYIKEARLRKSTQNLCEEIESCVNEREYKEVFTATETEAAVDTEVLPDETRAANTDRTTRQPEYKEYRYPVPRPYNPLPIPPTTSFCSRKYHTASYSAAINFERTSHMPAYRDFYHPTNTAQNPITLEESRSMPANPGYGGRESPSRGAEVMDIVRKWGLKFDSTGNALEFIKRVEELTECYGVKPDDMLRTLPEIFRGTALEWYRINRDSFQTWPEFQQVFLEHFLPPRFIIKLEEEIARKRQGSREKAKEFIQAMQYLIHQHPRMRIAENIDRIYDNLRPEYRLYIRRRDFQTLGELMELAEEYEYVKNEDRHFVHNPPMRANPFSRSHPEPRPQMQLQAKPPYDRSTHCWNCKQRGHNKANCRRPFRMFCSFCGEDGRLTKDCSCHAHQAAVMGDMTRLTSSLAMRNERSIPKTTPLLHPVRKTENTKRKELPKETVAVEPANINEASGSTRTATERTPLITTDPRRFVPIKLYEHTFNALLDTGATKSFIGHEVRKVLRRNKTPFRFQKHAIHLANGAPVISREHYTTPLRVGKQSVLGELTYIKQLSEDMIIGIDILEKLNFTMTLNGEKVSVTRGKYYNLRSRRQPAEKKEDEEKTTQQEKKAGQSQGRKEGKLDTGKVTTHSRPYQKPTYYVPPPTTMENPYTTQTTVTAAYTSWEEPPCQAPSPYQKPASIATLADHCFIRKRRRQQPAKTHDPWSDSDIKRHKKYRPDYRRQKLVFEKPWGQVIARIKAPGVAEFKFNDQTKMVRF